MATQVSKRTELSKSKTRLFVALVIASIISSASLVAAIGYYRQASYLNKVTSAKEDAVEQLKINKDAVSSLEEAYKTFASLSPNMLGGIPAGNNERDGDNGRLVLDALPSSYDFPALATSLEKLLAGYTINSITGTDDATAQAQANAAPGSTEAAADSGQSESSTTSKSPAPTTAPTTISEPKEISFSINVKTDYDGYKKLVKNFERSIRPIKIVNVSLTGRNTELQVTIDAKTYYQPETGLKIIKKEIK
jgi:hypothetical protein